MRSRAARRAQDRERKRALSKLAKGVPDWTPFEEGVLPRTYREIDSPFRVVMNSRYQVNFFHHDTPFGPMIQLSIKRRDKEMIHDWRELQRIKNELLGEEVEAVELYPADSRLVDTSNQYHLWCLPEGMRFPFGYTDRLVGEGDGRFGSKQRPFEPGFRPKGCITSADMDRLQEKLTEVQDGNAIPGASVTKTTADD